jgi:DNA-binding transcriptional LysR family regulator
MSDIDQTALRRLDMTMLLVFAETMRLRKLTLVAKQLGLTQSAISHTVGRLRDVFHDPLFLRKPHGIEPTARALALEPRIAAVLALTQETLSIPEAFNPATAKRRFRIASVDHHASIFGPALCSMFEREAKGLGLMLRSAVRQEALDLLDRNDVDVVIGFTTEGGQHHIVQRLYEETYAVVARQKNKTFDGSTKTYLTARHILVSLSGDMHGIVDEVLQSKGMKRHVAAVFPLFLPALATVSETDMIATLPKRLAEANAVRFKLKLFPPPITIRPYPVNAIWHRRNEKDEGLVWMVQRLAEIATQSVNRTDDDQSKVVIGANKASTTRPRRS